jgi:hypothetical protein
MKLINILKEMSLDTSNLPDGGDCFDSAYDYMVENGFDSYLVPSQFDGEIYYAKEAV